MWQTMEKFNGYKYFYLPTLLVRMCPTENSVQLQLEKMAKRYQIGTKCILYMPVFACVNIYHFNMTDTSYRYPVV